jgi:hypothetical protein
MGFNNGFTHSICGFTQITACKQPANRKKSSWLQPHGGRNMCGCINDLSHILDNITLFTCFKSVTQLHRYKCGNYLDFLSSFPVTALRFNTNGSLLETTIILRGASPAALIATFWTCLFKLTAQKTQQLIPEKFKMQETNASVPMI